MPGGWQLNDVAGRQATERRCRAAACLKYQNRKKEIHMRPVRIFTITLTLIALCLIAAGPALAQQSPCDAVGLVVDPATGVPGDGSTATGGSLMNNSETEFYWDAVGPSSFLGQVLSDGSGDFVFDFNVPADATAGTHQVIMSGAFANESMVQCQADFVVVTVQTDAYTPALAAQSAVPGVLPSTGLMLLVPLAGFGSAGIGAAIIRKRRR